MNQVRTAATRLRAAFVAGALLLFPLLLTGCGAASHRACIGGALILTDMQFNSRANDRLLDDHVYFSKEASSGGRSFGGSGCGCN